jgi:hypothetical protein
MNNRWVPRVTPVLMTEGSFTNVADGNHEVNFFDYIDKWVTDGNPFFSPDKLNQELKIGIKFTKTDGTEGPAMTLTVPELYALAMFGFEADLSAIKPKYATRTNADVLKAVRDAVNQAKHTLVISSRKGWANVSRIPSIHPPLQSFKVRFEKFARYDGKPGYDWVVSDNGSSLLSTWKIVGNEQGKPCLWNDYTLTKFFNDGFTTRVMTEQGELRSEDTGEWYFSFNMKTGEHSKAAQDWKHFGLLFLSSQLEAKTEWTKEEVLEPHKVFCAMSENLEDAEITVNLQFFGSSKRVDFSLKEAYTALNSSSWDWEAEENIFVAQPLVDYLNVLDSELLDQDEVAHQKIVFTDKGKAWATSTFIDQGVWANAGLTEEHRQAGIITLNEQQIKNLLEALNANNL